MKRINCFIPYGKIEATRQTVAQLAESSLVSQIYLITDDPHAKAIYPCNLIRTENIWSTKTLREIAGYASAHYTLIYTKTEELQLGMYALERFVAIRRRYEIRYGLLRLLREEGGQTQPPSGDRLPERKS